MFAIFLEFWPPFLPFDSMSRNPSVRFLPQNWQFIPPVWKSFMDVPKHNLVFLQDSKAKKGTYLKQSAGGTVGLFTGISLMSGVEALYWIYKVGAIC